MHFEIMLCHDSVEGIILVLLALPADTKAPRRFLNSLSEVIKYKLVISNMKLNCLYVVMFFSHLLSECVLLCSLSGQLSDGLMERPRPVTVNIRSLSALTCLMVPLYFHLRSRLYRGQTSHTGPLHNTCCVCWCSLVLLAQENHKEKALH